MMEKMADKIEELKNPGEKLEENNKTILAAIQNRWFANEFVIMIYQCSRL